MYIIYIYTYIHVFVLRYLEPWSLLIQLFYILYQVQDLEGIRIFGGKGYAMPLNINNIDVTVSANSIYGMTNGILTGVFEATLLDDEEIQVSESET